MCTKTPQDSNTKAASVTCFLGSKEDQEIGKRLDLWNMVKKGCEANSPKRCLKTAV